MHGVQVLDKVSPRSLVHGPCSHCGDTGPRLTELEVIQDEARNITQFFSVSTHCGSCKKRLDRCHLYERETKKDQERKVKIIAWLLPRFHKGLSDPKQYEKLIGKVEP